MKIYILMIRVVNASPSLTTHPPLSHLTTPPKFNSTSLFSHREMSPIPTQGTPDGTLMDSLNYVIDTKVSEKMDSVAKNMDRALAGKISNDVEIQDRVEGLEKKMKGMMIVNGVMAVVGSVIGVWVFGWLKKRKEAKGEGERRRKREIRIPLDE